MLYDLSRVPAAGLQCLVTAYKKRGTKLFIIAYRGSGIPVQPNKE